MGVTDHKGKAIEVVGWVRVRRKLPDKQPNLLLVRDSSKQSSTAATAAAAAVLLLAASLFGTLPCNLIRAKHG